MLHDIFGADNLVDDQSYFRFGIGLASKSPRQLVCLGWGFGEVSDGYGAAQHQV